MIEAELIARRQKARGEAIALGEILGETMAQVADDCREAFIEELARFWPRPKLLPAAPGTGPMTFRESKAFGDSPMPFGVHQNKRIDDVPLDYLVWVVDLPFAKQLKRYLASERVKEEREGEGEEGA